VTRSRFPCRASGSFSVARSPPAVSQLTLSLSLSVAGPIAIAIGPTSAPRSALTVGRDTLDLTGSRQLESDYLSPITKSRPSAECRPPRPRTADLRSRADCPMASSMDGVAGVVSGWGWGRQGRRTLSRADFNRLAEQAIWAAAYPRRHTSVFDAREQVADAASPSPATSASAGARFALGSHRRKAPTVTRASVFLSNRSSAFIRLVRAPALSLALATQLYRLALSVSLCRLALPSRSAVSHRRLSPLTGCAAPTSHSPRGGGGGGGGGGGNSSGDFSEGPARISDLFK
jgi:hypothetical protein